MDLEFHVNAVYSDGLVEDHVVQVTSGTTVFATAGLTFAADGRLRISAELFYSWLKVARPPSTAAANESLLNGRVFVSYRVGYGECRPEPWRWAVRGLNGSIGHENRRYVGCAEGAFDRPSGRAAGSHPEGSVGQPLEDSKLTRPGHDDLRSLAPVMTSTPRLLRSFAWLLALAAGVRLEAQSETYAVDPATSHVRIHLYRAGLMKFLGHDHEIEAPIGEGRVEVVDGDPARSRVALRFESARLSVVPGSEPADDIPKVEERMRGPKVLDVERYPEIAFSSTSVESFTSDGARAPIVVTGTLTLRGRSFPVEIPLEVARGTLEIEARGVVDLKLRDLGIEPPSVAGVVKVANRLRLEFEIRARATAQP